MTQSLWFLAVCLLLCTDRLLVSGAGLTAQQILEEAEAMQDWLVSKRRDLHKTPELGFAQLETSRKLRMIMEEQGIAYTFPYATTGIVARVGQGPPYVTLQVPMDALPVEEPEDCLYRSETPGVFYANGHDGLMAMMLGAMRLLKAHEADLQGTVLLVFQPASEGLGGAKAVIKDGAMKTSNGVFALRLDPALPSGTFATKTGIVTPASYSFTVTVRGKGQFAREPNSYTSPFGAATSMLLGLQALAVSVTRLNVSDQTSFHVVPDVVSFSGTIRSAVHDHMRGMKKVIVDAIAKQATTYKCKSEVSFPEDSLPHSPPTKTDKKLTELVTGVAKKLFKVKSTPMHWKADDISRYCSSVACSVGWLGIGSGKATDLNTARFVMDETQLSKGAAMNAAFAVKFLQKNAKPIQSIQAQEEDGVNDEIL